MIAPALRSIGHGRSIRDKATIAAHVATVALFPIGIAFRRIGHPLPDPRRLLGGYVVSAEAGIFECPPSPSPFFLGVDSTYDVGVCRFVDGLTGGVFVDVGASIGFIAVRAARRVERVIAVEPHPERFAYLRRNVELNGLDNVECINCAVGDVDSTIALYDVDPTLGPHPLDVSTRRGRGLRYDVPQRRLDDLVSDDVSVLKIDVEGAEVGVLRGCERVLAGRPTLLVESLGGETVPQLRTLLPSYSFHELDENNYLGSARSI